MSKNKIFSNTDKVSDHYDSNEDFATDLNHLIIGFEYPDWSHKTINDVFDAVSAHDVGLIVDSLNGVSVDRLYSLTEKNPSVSRMPPLVGGSIVTPQLSRWVSENYPYLKRIEEALPDLLTAANEYVAFAADSEVSNRLTGTAAPHVQDKHARLMSNKVYSQREMESAIEIARDAGSYGYQTENSRDAMQCFHEWAVEFEKTTYDDSDWMELIETFGFEKMLGEVREGSARFGEDFVRKSYDAAVAIASKYSSFDAQGKIIGATQLHVVHATATKAEIYFIADLDRSPKNNEFVSIQMNGSDRGRVVSYIDDHGAKAVEHESEGSATRRSPRLRS
jgi:hypothetical protein